MTTRTAADVLVLLDHADDGVLRPLAVSCSRWPHRSVRCTACGWHGGRPTPPAAVLEDVGRFGAAWCTSSTPARRTRG